MISNLDRRRFLQLTGGTLAGMALGDTLWPGTADAQAAPGPRGGRSTHLFTLGVASGDPLPDGFVLWTRLAPDPIHGGGMLHRRVAVHFEVATDEAFRKIVRRGTAVARAEQAHSVHVEVKALSPHTWYWYRFRAGQEISQVGRARTAPPFGAPVDQLRFAFASCQNWQDGYFTPLRHLAAEDLDFVVFLGDYIYESLPRPGPRIHNGVGEPVTLADYRNRYALYRTDPDLQAAHAAFPWLVTWDDHELDNNWADEIPQDPALQSPQAFLARRIAAFQAYYEHMPLRRSSVPMERNLRLYRRFGWGDLLQVDVLDTRQYRSDQPTTLAGAEDPAATMLGAEQERWLTDGLVASTARWNAVAQQVMIAQNDRTPGPAESYDFDNWDGYRVPRRRLLERFASTVRNPVVLTGDRHATWICDLKADFSDPASATVGAELTGTSITSGGDPIPGLFHAFFDLIKADSSHWKFIDDQRGYLRCHLDHQNWSTDLRVVSTVRTPEATVRTSASFVTEDGRKGVEVAGQSLA